jgi:hypothetical protein
MPDEVDLLRLFRDDTPGPSTGAWLRAQAAIAAARAEELPGRPPWRRRVRGRRRLFPIAAGLAAATLAIVLALVLPAGSPQDQIQTTAFVTHVEKVLASQDNLIEYASTDYPGHDTTVIREYRGVARISRYDSAGQLVEDQSVSPPGNGESRGFAVDYTNGTWSSMTLYWVGRQGPTSLGCTAPAEDPLLIIGSGGWSAVIRAALNCGVYRADGYQEADGVRAIRLNDTYTGTNTTLWIDPATYLPVRAVFTDRGQQVRADFRWLSPTSASLAQLHVAIPAGFRQVKSVS